MQGVIDFRERRFADAGETAGADEEGARFGRINVVASSRDTRYTTIPARTDWRLDPGAAYVHYTPNETIVGVEFPDVPEVGDRTLVADMSSTILSRPVDVTRFGLIYAGAQKNIGPAGLTLVFVRDDLIGQALPATPSAFDYKQQADNDSMLNTPPTYGIYIAGLVFKWIKVQGGVAAMEARNAAKAALLYGAIDRLPVFKGTTAVEDRSVMNATFVLSDAALEPAFDPLWKEAGISGIRGHRSVGGYRASMYNALPLESVQALVEVMEEFAKKNG